MAGRVAGKVALITGAARGQGRSHAVRLAAEGANILAVDLCRDLPGMAYPGATEKDLQHTVELVEGQGGKAIGLIADVRDVGGLEAAVRSGVESLGRLDIVVANAGIGPRTASAAELSEELWRDMLDIALTGAWHTAKVAIPHIRQGHAGGSVVLIGSASGLRAHPYLAHYVAAKHGIVGLTRSLALELAPENIRVNSVHTTQVDTPMIMNPATWALVRPDLPAPNREDFAAAVVASNALPVPWIEPGDVSNAVLFLASEESRYITGVALPVDAGSSIK